jgi:hypothetical protein
MMNAVQGIAAPSPALPPDALALPIGGRPLQFELSAALIVQAARPTDLDTWSVRVSVNGGPSRLFNYKMGTGGRDHGPDPLGVLKDIASDIAVAVALPDDEAKAADFLFQEGYAVWPSDALAMARDLTAVRADLSHVIGETGVTPAEFALHVFALPYTPRCTLPMPLPVAS